MRRYASPLLPLIVLLLAGCQGSAQARYEAQYLTLTALVKTTNDAWDAGVVRDANGVAIDQTGPISLDERERLYGLSLLGQQAAAICAALLPQAVRQPLGFRPYEQELAVLTQINVEYRREQTQAFKE